MHKKKANDYYIPLGYPSHQSQITSIRTGEEMIDPQDQQALIDYKIIEDKNSQNELVNAQNPYLNLRLG